MRKLILIAFVGWNSMVFAQTKILFDASKAEMASNADWVIDADQHNIGYNHGPAVLNYGNESNPQRYPTPSQSNITSTTPESYWEGGISAWGIELAKLGYVVETLPYNGSITYGNSSNPQDLSNYKVFIFVEPNIAFTNSEKTAIMTFVQNGGGLFMIADHDNSDRNNSGMDSPRVINDLMSSNSVQNDAFGIAIDYTWYDDDSYNIVNDPSDPILNGPYGNVTELQFYGASSMTVSTLQNSNVKPLIFKSTSAQGFTNVMFARSTFGSGRVAAMTDSSPPDDGSGDPNDNLYDGWLLDAGGNHKRLIMNATIWLINDQATSIDESFLNNPYQLVQNQFSFMVQDKNNEQKKLSFQLLNELGQQVYSSTIYTGQMFMIPEFQTGMYFYVLDGKYSGKCVIK